jgi:AraC-like DNA-binding protein
MIDVSHHIKALAPALKTLESLGLSAAQCLEGTGISESTLSSAEADTNFTLAQEFRFHRNALQLSGDPLLGLKVGQAYNVESYGLMGYAFLSAPTLRHGMTVVQNYGPLSFTLFHIESEVQKREAILRFTNAGYIPADLIDFYGDRDLAAALHGTEVALYRPIGANSVRVTRSSNRYRQQYESHFGTTVEFGSAAAELRFDAVTLDTPMPMGDPETSNVCQQQCQLLLARMNRSSDLVREVRQIIIARPGFFPDIDLVAERLQLNSRTLRRKLAAENSSYQQILDDVRYRLAREYLATSTLPLEEIAALLGYSAPGNFTHAFKRWHGSAPRQFRQENR